MPKAKKDGRHLNLYIERTVIEQLEQYCEDVGQTKTIAIERILTKHLNDYFNTSEEKRIF